MEPVHRHPGADGQTAFEHFYRLHVAEVFRYFARATGGDRRAAEDLTQETFMACVRAWSTALPDALTMPWLMGVARHKLVDHHRRRTREHLKLGQLWGRARPAPSERTADDETLHALRQLTDIHRLVLILRYVDDLPVAQVAEAIGRSVRATESLIVRARNALTEMLPEVLDA